MIDLNKLRESKGHVLAIVNTKTGEYEPVSDDVMSVVRCKDCIHRDWDVIDIPYGLTKRIEWCSIRFNADGENVEVSPNDFCSEAESKV